MTLHRPTPDKTVAQVVSLLTAYAFDFGTENAKAVVTYWITHYPDQWVRLAVIEALFQGRYKAISVEHLLKQWTKKKHPMFHFAREFELMVSQKLPKQLGEEYTLAEPLGFLEVEPEETRTTTPATKSPSRSTPRQAPPPIPSFTFQPTIPQQQSRSFQEFIPLSKKNNPPTQLQSVLQELSS